MPNKNITFAFSVTAVGNQTIATLAAALAAVPIDLAMCRLYSLMPTQAAALAGAGGDQTVTVGQTATRTIVLAMNINGNPGLVSPATATATVGGFGNGVLSLTLTNGDTNGDYSAPPIVGTTGGGGGKGMTAIAEMGIAESLISNQGSGYTAATRVKLANVQMDPDGELPVINPIPAIAGGMITAVLVTSPGSGLTTYPDLQFTDPGGGSGASGVMSLTVDELILTGPGSGYTSAPTITFSELFQVSNPDSTNQASTLRQWMQKVLEAAMRTPIFSAQPVIS
jgi:hypothetical protein